MGRWWRHPALNHKWQITKVRVCAINKGIYCCLTLDLPISALDFRIFAIVVYQNCSKLLKTEFGKRNNQYSPWRQSLRLSQGQELTIMERTIRVKEAPRSTIWWKTAWGMCQNGSRFMKKMVYSLLKRRPLIVLENGSSKKLLWKNINSMIRIDAWGKMWIILCSKPVTVVQVSSNTSEGWLQGLFTLLLGGLPSIRQKYIDTNRIEQI